MDTILYHRVMRSGALAIRVTEQNLSDATQLARTLNRDVDVVVTAIGLVFEPGCVVCWGDYLVCEGGRWRSVGAEAFAATYVPGWTGLEVPFSLSGDGN